ncbi:MAG TPA: SDR family oxidoreductase [Acidimicrobiales bacterium]|nr:SDR family oxidoreductase [Acidimicrobiales bacterium]
MTVSVVTGCSTGIGYDTALRLAADGHRVVATMRTPESCDVEAVARDSGVDLEVRALDVDDDASVAALFAGVLASHGQVDVLVNNAGIAGGGAVEETPLETYRQVMETNFFGALRCMQAVLPGMRERGAGCIVNVTSQAGRFAAPIMGAYSASKWALEAATESLAAEVAPFGIRVALIEPGMVLTAIWSKVDMTPPTGPYAPARKRLGLNVMTEMAKGSTGAEVADCIAEAISTPEPRLRWLVGQGAERNIANRRAMTDEEWIRIWNAPTDEYMAVIFAEPS